MEISKKKIREQIEILRSVCRDPDGDDIGDQIVELFDDEGAGIEASRDARDLAFFAVGFLEAVCQGMDLTYNELIDEYL